MNENVLANHFSTGSSLGASTNTPHSPHTTDGTAASRSTTIASGPRMRRGHNSVRKSAVAIATGTPSRSAIPEVTSVPTTSGRPWKIRRDASQLLPNTKLNPKRLSEACDCPISRTKK